jgi:rhodanese-related sulfurtransferase
MSASRLNQLHTMDAQTLKQGLDQQSVTLIDVRESGEFAGERIPGAILVPLSKFDLRKIPNNGDTQLVLYCRSGSRSQMAAQKLIEAGFESVSQLSGGIGAWKTAGFPTIQNPNAPISLMRQVQIVAGSFVVTGTVLGVLVSPWFLILSGFVGAGLIYAGITDTCMLGLMLSKLPYNQRSQV